MPQDDPIKPSTAATESLDVLYGAEQIAQFMFGSVALRRKVYHLHYEHGLPAFKLGASLCARKTKILQWITDQELSSDQSPKLPHM